MKKPEETYYQFIVISSDEDLSIWDVITKFGDKLPDRYKLYLNDILKSTSIGTYSGDIELSVNWKKPSEVFEADMAEWEQYQAELKDKDIQRKIKELEDLGYKVEK